MSGLMRASGLPLAEPHHLAAAALNPAVGGTQSAGAADLKQVQEPALLAQLVQLLGQRPKHSLLLSDLGALLPGPLRHGVKEKGGLRSWLQKYPNLFQVSGQPGKESVTLKIGCMTEGFAPGLAMKQQVSGSALANLGEGGADCDAAAAAPDGHRDEEEDENQAAVQLRGLPYRATPSDIKAWLGVHRESLKGDQAVQLVLNRDHRPSGFAKVQFVSPAAAKNARDDLDKTTMEVAADGPGTGQVPTRYVEIFLYSERPNKLRFKKATTSDSVNGGELQDDAEAAGVTREQVVQECREYMSSPGKGQLLLSMLGVALSPGSRAYLKKMDQGLKHFLSQYALEFSVEGAKGRECVAYLPALSEGMQNSDLPANFGEHLAQPSNPLIEYGAVASPAPSPPPAVKRGTDGPATGCISDLQPHVDFEAPPESPKVMPTPGTPRQAFNTPSDWGTPAPQTGQWDLGRVSANHRYGPVGAADLPIPGAPGLAGLGGPRSEPPFTNPLDFPPPYPWLGGGGAGWSMPPPPPGCWPPPPWQGAPSPWMGLPGLGQKEDRLDPPAWMCDPPGISPTPLLPPLDMDGALSGCGPPRGAPLGLPISQPPSPGDEEPLGSAVLRLRGLPFSTEEQDVLAFFAKYEVVEHIADQTRAVQMITKANGKPSGQALVHMRNGRSADIALEVLNGKHIGDRYIEVFRQNEADACVPRREPGTGSSGTPPPASVAVGSGTHGVNPLPGQFDGMSDTGGSGGSGLPQTTFSKDSVPDFCKDGVQRQQEGLGWVPGTNAEKEAYAEPRQVKSQKVDDMERSWEALFDFLVEPGAAGMPPPPPPAMSAPDPRCVQPTSTLRVDV
eukprot:CAMPEP_0178400922 /NCGR_PEP_ID=MMETSP0689_2-20121128/16037_1 /TAXON_ID=160604 /ORGANISM="Amphidinium massartii, Strain CS-259" /LENGTH=842 /DNA_ID=CAMNT_0020021729 /DNA_START=197 /DNA_END=2725 /DNA_ORIENTATION=-